MSHDHETTTQVIEGRPVLVLNGEPVPQSAYCDYISWSEDFEGRIREFAENGVRVFYIYPPPGEVAALWGFPDEGAALLKGWASRLTMQKQVDLVLKYRPDALLYMRSSSTVPSCWAERYPGDMQTDETGKRYGDATLASPQYLKDVSAFFRRYVAHCESQPWGDRIIGYLDAPNGEGLLQVTIAGKMFDCSPANEQAYQDWLRQRYATDQALQEAWGDPAATLAAQRVPRDRDWLAKRAVGPATVKGSPLTLSSLPSNGGVAGHGLFHWIEAGNAAPEHDYCRFQRAAFIGKFKTISESIHAACAELKRKRVTGFDITKQPLMGWQILSAFDGLGDGQSFPNILLLSGSWDSGEVMDLPSIDFIFTPADYHARTVGFAYEAEGLTDSLVLRGKTMIIENDARTYVGNGSQDQGAFRNAREVEAGLLRNAALTLSRGLQSYWCNVGSSYFHDDGIMQTVRRLVPMLDRLNTAPHRETRDAVAFVIDDESLLTEDFTSGYQTLAVIWQRVLGLAHCGIPYRIYLLSDLSQAKMPAYKTWFFPNLFVVNDRVLALLREKVLRDGNLAIFGPSTGISDGKFLGAEGATALLGVPMELIPRSTVRHVIVQDFGHPISHELPANMTYGDSLPYGPTLMPVEWGVEKSGGVPLGHATACWFIHRTGLFIKEEGLGAAGNGKAGARGPGDYAVLWTSAMPLPANLLRAAARYAGSHIWCEEDDVIYASESLLAVHSTKIGPRVLRLPRPCTVTDAMTGQKLGDGLREIAVEIVPPETRVFELA